MTYNLFCNFCGGNHEVSRWDKRTCSLECRSRLNRITKFSTGDIGLFCIICGKKFESQEKIKCCGENCQSIFNDIKVYGLTENIQERIKEAKQDSDESIIKKILKRRDKKE